MEEGEEGEEGDTMRFRLGVEQEEGSEEGEPGCIVVVRISDEYGWFILGQTPATQLPRPQQYQPSRG